MAASFFLTDTAVSAETFSRTAVSIRLRLEEGLAAFEVLGELGHGAFGVAKLVRSRYDGDLYVLKVLDLSRLTERERKASIGEVEVLSSLVHPNIVAYFGSFFEHGSSVLNIVLEYANGGDLSNLIMGLKARGGFLPEAKLLEWTCQLASAMKHVHDKNILHRDLKTSNVLIHKSATGARVVKLAG